MNDLIHFLEEADRYLDHQMTIAEREQFEIFCRQNEEAGVLLKEQIAIRNYLEEHADNIRLREQLNKAHSEWEKQEKEKKLSSESQTKVREVIPFKQYMWKVTGIAAAIALLIVAGGLWLSHHYNDHKINSYTILRREIDNIKRSQNNLMNDIHHSEKTIPANPGQYGGTGFALSTNGLIATNAHVVAGADSIYVETSQGEPLKAKLIYQDTRYDLAILKIEDSGFQLPAIPYQLRKSAVPLGDEVYTLGYPRDEIVYGKGYISAETGFRGDSNSYQISIPVNPGNSGGPLIDSKGYILGIITGKQSPSDNIAFAVKSSFLLNMLDSLPKDMNRKALLYKQNSLQYLNRVDQIKKLQKFIFLVKVYN